ncbi:MAG: ATP-grasp domain-containing protein [Sporichthyaceae bacterium]|nr:ATP-grasp domain-containing protein [Sporichthyaceae bacterium]
MKLLGMEARQNATYYLSRYQQVKDFGADLYILNGVGDPDYWPADRYRVAGSQHIDEIIAAARAWHDEVGFDGVFTFSESAVMTVAAVADALGLPSVGVDAARKSRNKLLMRQAYQAAGLPIPQFRLVADLDEAKAAAADFGYPVVLKPTLGAASNFVFRIDDPAELEVRWADAIKGMQGMSWYLMEAEGLDLGPYGLLVESYLDGHEHLFEALAWDDDVYLGSVVDRATVEGDTFDDDVHVAPTYLTDAQMAEIQQIVKAAAHAQGLRRSAMHAEIRFHQDKPHLVEIAIRPGGGGLDLVARVTADYCPIRAVMNVARGVKPRVQHYSPTGVYMMGTCLISQAGEVEYVTVPDEVTNSEQTLMAKITAHPGDLIKRPPEGNNILGFLILIGTSFDDVKQRLEDYAAKIDVKMVGQPVTRTKMPWSGQDASLTAGPPPPRADATAGAPAG